MNEKSKAFQIFIESINSDKTVVTYKKGINHFMRFIKLEDYEDVVKEETDTIQKWLEDWVIDQKKQGLKHNTIVGRLNAVELFLEMNKKIWYRKIVRKLLPANDTIPGGEVPFTTEEIHRMLQVCKKPRDAAILHFFASTAARPAAIEDPVLRIKHLEKIENCYAIKMYDGSKEVYWAFLTPEATKALDVYLSSRKLNGEVINSESPIFATYPNEPKTEHEWVSQYSVRRLFERLFKAAGIERSKEGNRFNKAIVYGLRKRFNTILKMDNLVNSNIAEKLMAHKNGLDGNYLKPTMEQCYSEFKKAIPQLIIEPTARQQAQIDNQQKKLDEIDTIKSRLSVSEEIIDKLVPLLHDDSLIHKRYVEAELDGIPNFTPENIAQLGEKIKSIKK